MVPSEQCRQRDPTSARSRLTAPAAEAKPGVNVPIEFGLRLIELIYGGLAEIDGGRGHRRFATEHPGL